MCDACGYPGDQHYVLGVAYPANKVDGHGEFMSRDSVRKAARSFIVPSDARVIGFHHADGTEGHGTVVDSFLWPDGAPDWVTKGADGNTQTVRAGDWLIGVEFDAETWPLIKTGKVNGWSIQGMGARRESEAPNDH